MRLEGRLFPGAGGGVDARDWLIDWLIDRSSNWLYSERDVVEAGLRWINADRKSRAGHVGQVIGRCVNFHKLDANELVWLSNVEPYILEDQTLRDNIYEANWSVHSLTVYCYGCRYVTRWEIDFLTAAEYPDPPKFSPPPKIRRKKCG